MEMSTNINREKMKIHLKREKEKKYIEKIVPSIKLFHFMIFHTLLLVTYDSFGRWSDILQSQFYFIVYSPN